MIMKFLLMADRYELIREKVRPALEAGHTVVSVRSFISTLVYQSSDVCDVATTALFHRFTPVPDVILLFDVGHEVAWSRIRNRQDRGIYETRDLLKMHRERYRDICSQLFAPQLKIVDSSPPIREVAEQVWQAVEATL